MSDFTSVSTYRFVLRKIMVMKYQPDLLSIIILESNKLMDLATQ